jgi:signal transduction histidine kinase
VARGLRGRWSARTALQDAGLVVVLDVVTALPLLHDAGLGTAGWLLDQALVLPLLVRRRWPLPVFGVVSVLASVQWLTGLRLPADAALLVALYTVASAEPRRRALLAAAVLELGVVLASVRFAPTEDGVVGSLVFLTGLVAAAYLLGSSVQSRREHLASVEERAVRLERERDQQARLGAIAERTRIARELHDIVAHNLSVMITLADGALAQHATAPEASAEAVRQVSRTGRQALTEMRRLLGVLRDDDADGARDPQPDLDRLDELLERVRRTGVTVRKTVSGEPRTLTPTAQLTVYRTVQEALTNVLKHAPGAQTVTVAMQWGPELLRVAVTDDGPQPAAVAEVGHGLAGMRERLALHGGQLTAGPGRPGGWGVVADLPLDECQEAT